MRARIEFQPTLAASGRSERFMAIQPHKARTGMRISKVYPHRKFSDCDGLKRSRLIRNQANKAGALVFCPVSRSWRRRKTERAEAPTKVRTIPYRTSQPIGAFRAM